MAAAKAKANTYVDKKRDSKNIKCFAITLLVEENNYRTSTAGKAVKPAVLDYMDDYFADLEADGVLGDWAVKAVQISRDQFKEGYESF